TERAAGAVEGDVLGIGQRDGWSLADGPQERGRIRQVRAGSCQADALDRPEHQIDRGRRFQLSSWFGLDRLEPHSAGTPENARGLPGAAPVRRQPRQRLLRVYDQLDAD